jgi:hypothetical protein
MNAFPGVATENKRGINCQTGYPVFGPHEGSSVRDSHLQMQNVREFQRIEDGGFNS